MFKDLDLTTGTSPSTWTFLINLTQVFKSILRIPVLGASSKTLLHLSIYLFLKYLFIFIWLMVGLQYWLGFCYISTWINHRLICPLPLESPSHLPPFPPLCVITEPQFEFPESYSKFPLAIYLTCQCFDDNDEIVRRYGR